VFRLDAAVRELTFPPGHPYPRTVYVGDPVRPRVHYPAADFHRKAFERKFADAVRLLMGLGATEIDVVHKAGWGRDVAADLNVTGLVQRVTNRTSRSESASSEILLSAKLDPSPAAIASDLAWLNHEPTWQTIVDGRLGARRSSTSSRLCRRSRARDPRRGRGAFSRRAALPSTCSN